MISSLFRARKPITQIAQIVPINPQVSQKLTPIPPSIQSHQNPCAQLPHSQNPSRVLQNCSFSTQSSKFPEYEMPSVTWGVVQGRKEKLVSRVIICDYLKSLGIVPDELENLELPSTVDVMRERVEFLQKLGLSSDDINEYPLMLGCSVRKNMIPVLAYLEKTGIPRSKLGEFVKNYPQVLHASVVVELVPVVKFLRGLDVEKQDIGYVLQKYPELLGYKLEGTMSTSVAYLVSIGVNPRDIGPMVTQYPYFLGMRVGTVIKPFVDFLVSLGLPKKILARMLEKRAYLLGYDLEETVKPNVDCLISFGIRREVLASVVAQYPQILGLPLKAKMSSQQYFFSLKLRIDPEGFARVIEKMPQIVSLHQHVIMKPVEFLLGRGIPSEDVAKMIVKCPQLIALRVELMKNSFYFFKSEMGRPLKELVEFPEYFTYSLESRIKPRYQRLQSKEIRCSLKWFLNCSDQRFEERLQGEYIETETSGPLFCMGGKLELPGNEMVSDEEDESDDEVLYRRTVSLNGGITDNSIRSKHLQNQIWRFPSFFSRLVISITSSKCSTPNCPNCREPYASVALMGKNVLKDVWGKSDLACAVCALQKQFINGMSCRYMWNQNRVEQTEQRIVKRHANFIINY